MNQPLVLSVVGVFLAILLSIGVVFQRMNRDTNDYFRAGCRGTWWLVGMSTFMNAFSAWTFTGGAGLAYTAGLSMTSFFIANVLGSLLAAAFFAPRLRQLRMTAMTEPDLVRYSPAYAQFTSLLSLIQGPLYSALQLYALAAFLSVMFQLDIFIVIIGAGMIVVLYSTLGGSWAVMASDYIQGLILVAYTALVAGVCLVEVGGLGGLIARVEAMGLGPEFQFVKPAATGSNYTWFWWLAVLTTNALSLVTLNNVSKYAAVRDGAAARKAALFMAALFLGGVILWVIPPMTARVLFPAEVARAGLTAPAEAAYAVAALQLLPPALAGVLAVTMLSATLSGMDVGLNSRAAVVLRVIYPALCRWLRRPPMTEPGQVAFSRLISFLLGLVSIVLALLFALNQRAGLLDLMLTVLAFFAGTSVPGLLGMFVRRVPPWASFVAVGCAMILAIMGLFSRRWWGAEWSYPMKIFSTLGAGVAGFFATMPFYHRTSADYRQRVDEFFRRMATPVNFAEEVGQPTDLRQLSIMGAYLAGVGVLASGLIFFGQNSREMFICAVFALSLTIMGVVLIWRGRVSAADQRGADVRLPKVGEESSG